MYMVGRHHDGVEESGRDTGRRLKRASDRSNSAWISVYNHRLSDAREIAKLKFNYSVDFYAQTKIFEHNNCHYYTLLFI